MQTQAWYFSQGVYNQLKRENACKNMQNSKKRDVGHGKGAEVTGLWEPAAGQRSRWTGGRHCEGGM